MAVMFGAGAVPESPHLLHIPGAGANAVAWVECLGRGFKCGLIFAPGAWHKLGYALGAGVAYCCRT